MPSLHDFSAALRTELERRGISEGWNSCAFRQGEPVTIIHGANDLSEESLERLRETAQGLLSQQPGTVGIYGVKLGTAFRAFTLKHADGLPPATKTPLDWLADTAAACQLMPLEMIQGIHVMQQDAAHNATPPPSTLPASTR